MHTSILYKYITVHVFKIHYALTQTYQYKERLHNKYFLLCKITLHHMFIKP